MRDSTPSKLRFLPMFFFLLLLAGAAGSGLLVIHLRQDESRLAKSTMQYHSQLTEVSRRTREAAAAVAQAEQTDALIVRVNGRLAKMTEAQTRWVSLTAAGMSRLALSNAAPAASINFNLAVNEPARTPLLR